MNKIIVLFTLFFLISNIDTQAQCGIDSVEIIITVQTDNYPLETSWQLVDQNGIGWYISPDQLIAMMSQVRA